MNQQLKLLKFLVVFLGVFTLIGWNSTPASAQLTSCDANVPFYDIDFTGQPEGFWETPSVVRQGLCCSATSPDRCVSFRITLDSTSVGVRFEITSGAIPPGALFYQIGCGPVAQVGDFICLSGAGPHELTFCKPGNNVNTYQVSAISRPQVKERDSVRVNGCSKELEVFGVKDSAAMWRSVYPGTIGQYNSYLSCTSGCARPIIMPDANAPDYIEYEVCGFPIADKCGFTTQFCDTIRVYILDSLQAAISPDPASFCTGPGNGVLLTATATGSDGNYSFFWYNSSNVLVDTTNTYFATTQGTYTVEIRDGLYSPICPGIIESITVTEASEPTVNAGGDQTICASSPATTLNGSVSGAAGGVWTGGSGTFSPDDSTLNATYTPTASEVSSGSVILTLTSYGAGGGCANQSDQVTLTYSPLINLSAIKSSPSEGYNISCNGGSDGTVNLTVNGGTSPFTYSWSNGATTEDLTNLTAGTYSVTVTDANSCTATLSVTMVEPPALTASASADAGVTCSGGSNGSATVTASGGVTPYSYLWSNGQTTQIATGLSSGTYTVTVTDANSCTTTASVTINQPTALSLSASVTSDYNGEDISCAGAGDGSATVNASGGTPPYSYAWSNGQTTQTATGLNAGTYTVTVTDDNSCTATASVTLNDPSGGALSASAAVTSDYNGEDISCAGASDGEATVTASGGTAPYTYLWSNGQTTQIATGLSDGAYSVTVTDANGCTATANVTLDEPSAVTANISVTTNYSDRDISCAGATDGAVTANTSGGVAPYTYVWSTGATTQSVSNLGAGTYSVTVTDANGCTAADSETLIEPDPVLVSATVTSDYNGEDISCAGASDGTASASASGGVGGFDYLWSNGQTGSTATGLSAGTYTVTVTDNNGCTATASVTLSEPSVLTASADVTSDYNGEDVSCNGASDGSASVSASGGVAPYTYAWSSGQTGTTASGLSAGTYTITVTDANACTATASVTLTEPAVLSATASVTSDYNGEDVSCEDATDGSATVNATGGVSPYSYLWSNGQTTQTATGLGAGTYSVTVTDANGCTTTESVTLTEPSEVTADAEITNDTGGVSCAGSSDGEATVTPGGGVPPYSYAWSDGQTTQTATGLSGGTYTVTVTDVNGCTASDAVTLSDPSPVDVNISVTSDYNGEDISCSGASDGEATVTVSGGTSPYSYIWTNGSTDSIASGLGAGTHCVTVTDDNGCTETACVTLVGPDGLSATASVTSDYNGEDISCAGGSDGEATANPVGGTSPYSYAWSNGQTTQTATGLSAGTYGVTITDANGCSATASVTLNDPAPVGASASVSSNYNDEDISCAGASDGSATASGSGGVPPYSFAWSNGQTTQTATGLSAGTYTVTITDANGCTASASVTLNDPDVLTASAAVTSDYNGEDVSCSSANDASIGLTVSGGTGAVSYSWSNGATTQNISGVGAGTYCVTVTDANGCTVSDCATVTEPDALSSTVSVTSDYNGFDVSCNGATDGTVNLTVSGGVTPYTYSWSNGATTQDLNGIGAGTYSVTITDANGCTITDDITLNEPPALNASASVTSDYNGEDISCNGASDGEATASPTGGVSPYSYLWSNGQTTQTATGLSAGTYTVTVTDDNGCTTTANVTLTEPADVTASASVTSNYNDEDISCAGATDGSATVNAAGGVAPYTYAWSSGQTGTTASGLSAGTYTITVTDANGCTTTASVTLNDPDALNANAVMSSNYSGFGVSCQGATDGSIDLTASGGTGALSYSWSNGATTQDLSNIGAGTYCVTVTDANGCTISDCATVTEPTVMTTSITITSNYNGFNVSCNGATDGSLNLTVNGAASPFTYQWSNGATTQDLSGIGAGSYFVTVTDANGCQAFDTAALTQPAILTVNVAITDNISCNGAIDGEAAATPAGGVAGYSYLWSNGQTNQTATGLSIGTHTVTVTDANGCTVAGSVTFNEPDQLLAAVIPTHVSCFGGDDGAANLIVSGGTFPFTYAWSNGDTTENIDDLQAGVYDVTVVDVNGCSATATTTITQPTAVQASISSHTYMGGFNISCDGRTDGNLDLTVNGGTPPYTYIWSNDSITTQDQTGLGAGTYTVTVTDANGCTTTATKTLTEPNTLESTVNALAYNGGYNVTCNGATNGSAWVTVVGGETPYTYLWSNSATTDTISGLGAGTYVVTVTDANGCSDSDTITLIEPPVLTTSITSDTTNGGTNISCNGRTDGNADASVSGGTPPYTYIWSNGATTQDLSGIGAGTYMITATDANGCTASATITITQPDTLRVTAIASTVNGGYNISCNGAMDGSITLTVTGGSAPMSYLWSTGATTKDLTGLGAGTYCVTVTDTNGCTASTCATLTEPDELVAASIVKSVYAGGFNISCEGACDGSADLTVTGGQGPFTYIWSNGATTQDLSNICAGTYSVTVTDANGCTITASTTLTEPNSLDVATTATSNYNGFNISCRDACDGSALATVSGGTPPLSFIWSNGATTAGISGLCAGAYAVTVTDANGCSDMDTVTISQPPLLQANVTVTTNFNGFGISCNGECDAAGTVVANGGVAPYIYLWSNGAVTASISNLCEGSYTVTVTDANGCTATGTITVMEPPLLTASASVTSDYNGEDISCFGASDGSATVTPTGGVAPYTYNWSNGGTTQSITGLLAGTYIVTVTDDNGCTTTASVTLNDPPLLVATAAVASDYNGFGVSCNGAADGCVTVTATGGVLPYTYLWNTGATTDSVCSLGAGTYSVTVTDANGCTDTSSVTLSEPPEVQVDASVTTNYNGYSVSCNGACDASAVVTVIGGVNPYTYDWGKGSNTASIINICPGTYTVTVTDANGCTGVDTIVVTEPPVLQATATVTSDYNGFNVSCNGATDGTAEVTATGGVTPYSYLWSNGDTTAAASGLGAGTYIVTVTDANNCTDLDTVTLTEPTVLSATASVTTDFNGEDISCGGAQDGCALAVASGGVSPYTYLWSNGATVDSVCGLGAGTYTVTVTDANGCTATASVTLDEPQPVTATAVVTTDYNGEDISCTGEQDGCAQVSATGGVAPYTYSWSTGQTTDSICGLGAGTYDVTVTDANGCTGTASVTLNDPPQLSATAAVTTDYNGEDISCAGEQDGCAGVTATGGVAPYTYLWSTGAITDSICNLGAGTYTVTVTDANGCTTTATVTLEDPQPVNATASVTTDYNGQDISCTGETDACIAVSASGGVAPYSYVWSTGATSDSICGLGAGTYDVTVTDANGCTATASVTVNDPPQLNASASVTSDHNGSDVSCPGSEDGSVAVNATGGVSPYSYEWSTSVNDTLDNLSGLGAGTYTVTVTDANGCTTTASATITDPDTISISAEVTNVTCFGSDNGAIDITATGGSGTLTYIWSNSATTEDLTGITAGTYTVTVMDANECSNELTITVNEDPLLTIESEVTNVLCFGGNDGSIKVDVSGGVEPYNIIWSNGMTTADNEGLTAGTYIITIVDENGCLLEDTFVISQPDELVTDTLYARIYPDEGGHNVSAFGVKDGEIYLEVLGGVGPYTYEWDPINSSFEDPTDLGVGMYTVTVTDMNGCVLVDSIELEGPENLQVPTGFSPNGDGINDFFVVRGIEAYPDNRFIVYNRWGNIVYSKDSYDNTWDGRNSLGEELPDGTYFFILEILNNPEIKPINHFVDLRR